MAGYLRFHYKPHRQTQASTPCGFCIARQDSVHLSLGGTPGHRSTQESQEGVGTLQACAGSRPAGCDWVRACVQYRVQSQEMEVKCGLQGQLVVQRHRTENTHQSLTTFLWVLMGHQPLLATEATMRPWAVVIMFAFLGPPKKNRCMRSGLEMW